MPENLQAWKEREPEVRQFRILDPLFQSGDNRLARAMVELCKEQIQRAGLINPAVAMVDHGTPLPEVNQVREDVGEQMRQLLGTNIGPFSTCAMERRPDPQYDFNNPLLEDLLQQWMETGVEEVVLSQFFCFPEDMPGPGRPRPDLPAFYRSRDENLQDTKSWSPLPGAGDPARSYTGRPEQLGDQWIQTPRRIEPAMPGLDPRSKRSFAQAQPVAQPGNK